MDTLFRNVLTASFHGSVIILAVLVLRLALRRTPRKFICLLWLLAGLRLLMPFEIQSNFSLQPDPQPVQTRWEQWEEPALESTWEPEIVSEPAMDAQEVIYRPEASNLSGAQQAPQSLAATEPERVDAFRLAAWIWFAVACCFGVYTVAAYVSLKRRVRFAVKISGGWECEGIDTAFILGFLRPQIYIPMGLPRDYRQHILSHEQTHLEKGDHWLKMVGYLALALHWFNPLVWIAYALLCKDIEVACDQRVVQFMELAERKAYSQALLHCASHRVHLAACPVAFGEVSVKERIRSVLNYRKPGFWFSLLGVAAIGFVAVCLVTSPAKSTENGEEQVITVSDADGLIAAIAPDTIIQLEAGTYTLSDAKTYGGDTGNPYCVWSEVYDGYELKIKNVQGLTIRGDGRVSTNIETDPRYAAVLSFCNTWGVSLTGFTAGHTEQGECSGGVVLLEDCSNTELSGLGLYGCGVVGLESWNSTNVVLKDSEIYDCSSSAVNLMSSRDVEISNCQIYRIGRKYFGGWTYADINDSRNVSFTGCKFSDSQLNCLVSAGNCGVTMENCVFTGNRIEGAAFQSTAALTLEDNTFRDNSIRKWFGPGESAVDAQGAELTEEIMARRYGETKQAATGAKVEIHVSTVDELLAAIGPNREVILDAELYDLSTATGYGTAVGDYYYWFEDYDGPGLVIQNVSNMTIRSADGVVTGHTISAVPRYADVFEFAACSDITLSGFTAGHTIEPGSCMGGVLHFTDCDRITVDNCGLYGCGILGVSTEHCDSVTVKNCDIYECSEGGVKMWDTSNIVLENNTFRDLGGDATTFIGCTNVTMDGALWENMPVATPEDPLFSEDAQRLKDAATSFANAYVLERSTLGMEALLAGTYDGEVEPYPQTETPMTISEVMMSGNHAGDMETYGCCMVEVFILDNAEDPFQTRSLFLEMVREQGEWKVAYFALDRTEIASLDSDIWNFTYTYCDKNETSIRQSYLADPNGEVTLYPGNDTPVLAWLSVKDDGLTNAMLKKMDTYSCDVPLVSEDTERTLHIELRRRENPQSYTDEYGNTLRQTDWVVTGYSLNP